MKYLLSIFWICLSVSVMAQGQGLHLSSDIWPPFTGRQGDKALALDLVYEALERNGIAAETELVSFEEVLDGILAGTYDGSAALWKTRDREDYLLYSEPYLENRLVLVGRVGSDVSASSLSELNNKRVSIVSGYAYGSSIYTSPGITILPGKSDQHNLESLLEGKTDYMLVDEIIIQYMLQYQHSEVKKYLAVGSKAIMTQPLYLAILKSTPNAGKIIENFNASIIQMMADGTYNEILELNWIQYDVDGDGVMELVMNGESAGTEAPVSYYALMSASGLSEPSNRYYINGQMYDGWNHVPQKYKTGIKNVGAESSGSSGLKLKF